jgi:UDP-N-acetylglucosamine 2-epimerase
MYGKPFFIYEIQNLMKENSFSTVYFHRLDNLFTGASSNDCKQLITDIRDFARYYNKKVIFSIDENTQLGEILLPILKDEVDYEHTIEESCDNCIKKALQEPVNLVLHAPTLKPTNRKISL